MASEQHDFANKLKTARRVASSAVNTAQAVKEGAKAAFDLAKLAAYIDPFMDWLYGIALIFAIIKDVLDLPDEALIAAYGAGEILIIITTLICSIAIFFIMLLAGSSGKGKVVKGLLKKFGVLAGATIVEMIPAIDSLPIESISVIAIFIMTLIERKTAADGEKANAGSEKKTTNNVVGPEVMAQKRLERQSRQSQSNSGAATDRKAA